MVITIVIVAICLILVGYFFLKRIGSKLSGDQDKSAIEQFVSCLKKAANGDPMALFDLGVCYNKGIGVKKDLAKALEFYRKAADLGLAQAQFALGLCYETCNGVERDYTKAVEWYRKAAEQGFPEALCNLGICYERGNGVEQDYAKAVEWYQKAIAQGDTNTRVLLELCLAQIVENAKKGIPQAQYALAKCYANGCGVVQDFDKALGWCLKAVMQGHTSAQELMRGLSPLRIDL